MGLTGRTRSSRPGDWPARDWAGLIGVGNQELRQSHAGQIGSNARPCLADDAVRQVQDVLAGWGYQRHGPVLTSAIRQMLLLNRSPLLEDLTDETLARLRAEPAMGAHSSGDV
jgi:hypothetical protein